MRIALPIFCFLHSRLLSCEQIQTRGQTHLVPHVWREALCWACRQADLPSFESRSPSWVCGIQHRNGWDRSHVFCLLLSSSRQILSLPQWSDDPDDVFAHESVVLEVMLHGSYQVWGGVSFLQNQDLLWLDDLQPSTVRFDQWRDLVFGACLSWEVVRSVWGTATRQQKFPVELLVWQLLCSEVLCQH